MRAVGFGVEAAERSTGIWGAVLAGPAVQLHLTSRLALWVEVDVALTVVAPEFHVRNLGTLYVPPRIGSRLAAGFEVNF